MSSRTTLLFIALTLPVQLLPAQALYARQQETAGFQKEPVEKVFKALGARYKVRFFYSGSVAAKNAVISMPQNIRSLEEALQYLSEHYDFLFRQQDNMISVSLKSARSLDPVYQERIVKGRVGLLDGDRIIYAPGVTVRESGTTSATITDEKGYFNLRLKGNSSQLIISYLGYETSQQEAGANTMLNVTLKPAVQAIREVIISTGYQSLAKKNTTGAYSSLSPQEIERRSSQSLNQILEGSIPGLTLATRYTGLARDRQAAGVDLQLRGGSAIAVDRNQPLIVVDGFPVNQLPDNMNDVEKIDVLKDAAAAAIWGARASNGVIVITTRRGKDGKVRINYAANTYFTQRPDYSKLHRASSADIMDYDKELYDKGYVMPVLFEGSPNGYSPSFDLLFRLDRGDIDATEFARLQDSLGGISNQSQIRDQLTRTGLRQNHYLSLSGGSDRYRYIISGSYDNNKPNFPGNKDESFQLNTRSDLEVTRNLRFSVDVNAVFANAKTGSSSNFDIQQLPPYQLLLDGQGNYIREFIAFNQAANSDIKSMGYLDNGRNLLEEARLANNATRRFGIRTKIGGQWKIWKGLTFNTDFLFDRLKTSGKNIMDKNSYAARSYINRYANVENGKVVFNIPNGNILDQTESTNNNWALRSQLNYTTLIDSRHFINVIAGYEMKKNVTEGFGFRKFGYDDELLAWQFIDQKKLAMPGLVWWNGRPLSSFDPNALDRFNQNDVRERSYYGTAAYTYDDRYTFTASYRVDQSNMFGADPKYRRTPLWSVGGAWNIAGESFFKVPAVNTLKLRVTAGLTGNYDRTTTPKLVATRSFQASLGDYRARVDYYNPKLRWERTRTINTGLDVGLLKNRFQVSVDYYNRFGYDLLGSVVLDPTVGFTQFRINASEMTNKGLDLAIEAKIIEGRKFRWSSRLNAGYNRNKITDNKIQDPSPTISRVTGGGTYVEGYAREALWSYRWAGLDERGNPQVYGDKDEKVKQAVFSSLVNNGVYRAPYSGGFTNIFHYKDLFASAFLTYNFGHIIRRYTPDMNGLAFGTNYDARVSERWRKPGDEAFTDLAAITPSWGPDDFYDGRERAIQYSTNSEMPGAYIRLREIQLGYKLPAALIKRTFLQSVSFVAQMNNVALWKKNKFGIDPEAVDPVTGTYFLPEPRVTTFTLRVEL
ncbi:SusC/RagA family TonB-linked outer membrane protein [Chitinophaga rhizosphaerae]|uniref:SusC/RagA family TonB-linked outer membrane protein n=1 Tax=Chitinophaga rhizosphaerae TaxID=1864947 RepID=UPI0013E0569A|nr:SusC/RagA family TonB-linked outer membrane protein [Chitinophaga rhizosphaerae]